MLSLINEVIALLLSSFSFPAGYLIGAYTDSEISGVSKRIGIVRIFGLYFLVLEIAILLIAYGYADNFYIVILDVVTVSNVAVSALYTAIKFDLIKLINYQVIFLVASLISALLLNIL